MIIKVYSYVNVGYIAGAGEGIVSVGGKPASRKIYVFDPVLMTWVQTAKSLPNGRYLIQNLDPNKQYLIIARDHNKEYEPAVWDYVTPATDLTIQQQQELWQSWQTLP